MHVGGAAAQVEAVGVAEEAGADGEAARHPVAEDHRGEADVAAAAGLALQVEGVGHDGQEDAAEAGQTAGDDHGEVLVLVDVDAEGLGGHRVLAAGAQPQAERGAPEDPPGAGDERDGDQGQPGDIGDQAAEQAGDVGDEEPALGVEVGQPVGQSRHGEVAEGLDRRGLLGGAALVALEGEGGQVAGGAEGEDVDRHTGDDVVDVEGDGDDRVQQAAEAAADHADEDAGPRTPLEAGPGAEPGAQDQHAFEADVHHARALGPQAAEAGEADRHGELEGGGHLADVGDAVGAGDQAHDRGQRQGSGDDQQQDGPGHAAAGRRGVLQRRLVDVGRCGRSGHRPATSFVVLLSAPRTCPAASSAPTRRC
ncbi:hypothetical protein SALBM217S_05740 [Streptomyces griseoloalbus]